MVLSFKRQRPSWMTRKRIAQEISNRRMVDPRSRWAESERERRERRRLEVRQERARATLRSSEEWVVKATRTHAPLVHSTRTTSNS